MLPKTIICAATVAFATANSLALAADDRLVEHSTQWFVSYYVNNSWESEGTRSGPGSTLESTHALRPKLQQFFSDYDIKSFLDIPSGDFYWQRAMDWNHTRYIGMDVVPAMISANQSMYGTSDGAIRFEVGHLAVTPLPLVDCIMVRDLLIHQPFEMIFQSLRNIARSEAKYVLLSTYRRHFNDNFDIAEGQWRPVNLEIAPIGLPPAELYIDEECPEAEGQMNDKALGLWRIETLREALSGRAGEP